MNSRNIIFKLNKIFYLSKTNFKNSIREAAFGEYFWIVFAFFILVFSKTFIFSKLFNTSPIDYFFYISVSLSAWQYLHNCIVSGVDIFFRNKILLNYCLTPLEWQLIKFSEYTYHYLIKIFFLLLINIYFDYLKLFPLMIGILLIAIICFLSLKIFSILGVFFRDFSQFIKSMMNIFFFITPIIWLPIGLSDSILSFLKYNPFYYFISINYPSFQIDYFFLGYGKIFLIFCIVILISLIIDFMKIKIKKYI
jgi:lipopolysaccharide transport system permease protein|tara:strand:- start:15189 stop:15941 length:753 start_codon:yes stop_codon:yes gene_type:complete